MRHRRQPFTLFAALTLAALAAACGGSGEEAPAGEGDFQYTATEVAAMVDGWPSGWPGAGEVSTALIAVCQGANKSGGEVEIHPFEATPLDEGRWKVTTKCDFEDADTGPASFEFEWVFFEEGPRLEASGGRAADVTGQ